MLSFQTIFAWGAEGRDGKQESFGYNLHVSALISAHILLRQILYIYFTIFRI